MSSLSGNLMKFFVDDLWVDGREGGREARLSDQEIILSDLGDLKIAPSEGEDEDRVSRVGLGVSD